MKNLSQSYKYITQRMNMPRWTAEEHNTLVQMLVDGISIQSLMNAIPSKSEGAIVTRARNKKLGLDFRTSRGDGKLYKGVKRREFTNGNIEVEDAVKSVGTSRVAPTTLEVKSDNTDKNSSHEIIPEEATSSSESSLIPLYEKLELIVSGTSYPAIQSITIELKSSSISFVKKEVL